MNNQQSQKVQVILADWAGYPLRRQKRIGKNLVVECGLERILENMSRYKAGVSFELYLVVNYSGSEVEYLIKRIIFAAKRIFCSRQDNDFFSCFGMGCYAELVNRFPIIKKIFVRSNFGCDIGAYNFGYSFLKKNDYDGLVVFLNSSLRGPFEDGWLLKYIDLFERDHRIGLYGISLNSHNTSISRAPLSPHVQSFFLLTKMTLLRKIFPFGFPGRMLRNDKLSLIAKGEIGISERFLKAGYGIACRLYPDFVYFQKKKWTIPAGEMRLFFDNQNHCNTI